MRLLVGQTMSTTNGDIVTILKKKTSHTFPFFPEFYVYWISINTGKPVSVSDESLRDFLNGKPLLILL